LSSSRWVSPPSDLPFIFPHPPSSLPSSLFPLPSSTLLVWMGWQECFNSPYGTQHFPKYAEEIPGATSEELKRAARESGVYVVGGSIPERAGPSYYNTSLVFDPHGDLIASHRKVHLFDIDVPGKIKFKESEILSPGDSVTVFDTSFPLSPPLPSPYLLFFSSSCSILIPIPLLKRVWKVWLGYLLRYSIPRAFSVNGQERSKHAHLSRGL